MDRRHALVLVGGLLGIVKGKAVFGSQGTQMLLALDSTSEIVVIGQGRRAVISVNELLDAVGATPAAPTMQQLYRGK